MHDNLKRQTDIIKNGITTTKVLDAAGNVLELKRTGSGASPTTIRLESAAYDLAGRMSRQTNGLDGVTLFAESKNGSGQLVRTTTHPDQGARIETYYKDGSPEIDHGRIIVAEPEKLPVTGTALLTVLDSSDHKPDWDKVMGLLGTMQNPFQRVLLRSVEKKAAYLSPAGTAR